MILRLSQKLAKKLKTGSLSPLPPDENPYADWSANLFTADRTQYILFTNTKSLYSVVMYGKGITDNSLFIRRALENLREFMEDDGQASVYQRLIAPATGSLRFGKALNRSVTGSMNDMIFHAKYWLIEGELSPCDVSFKLNEIPMSALKGPESECYGIPRDAFQLLADDGEATHEFSEPQQAPSAAPPTRAKASRPASNVSSIPVSERLYQFKITLLDYRPPIWRRIQVKDCTLDKFHERIQTAMGWTNSHLHQFEVGGAVYGDPELIDQDFDECFYYDSTITRLSEIIPKDGKRFRFKYEYDFGDGWEHEIWFEGCLRAEKVRDIQFVWKVNEPALQRMWVVSGAIPNSSQLWPIHTTNATTNTWSGQDRLIPKHLMQRKPPRECGEDCPIGGSICDEPGSEPILKHVKTSWPEHLFSRSTPRTIVVRPEVWVRNALGKRATRARFN